MKLQLMPQSNHLHPTTETAPVFQTYSKRFNLPDKHPINRAPFFLSFFLPLFMLGILMYYKQISPFGSLSLFRTETSDPVISVFYRFASQLHDNSFSLLNPSGAFDMTMGEAFPFYLTSPFTLIAALFPLPLAFSVLSTLSLLRIGFSGTTMFQYLTRKEKKHFSIFDPTALLLSTAYALSSCFVVQQIDYRFLDWGMLFPLLMLAFERMLWQKKHLPYFILLTVLLYNNVSCGVSVLLILFLYLITRDHSDMVGSPKRRFIIISILSLFTSIPVLVSTIRTTLLYANTYKAWPDFALLADWPSFFTRFIPDGEASVTYTLLSGSNLYFSAFLLFIFILYFFQTEIAAGNRIREIIFFSILVLILNTTPLRHLFSIFSFEQEPFISYAFVFVFFAISACGEVIYSLRSIPFTGYLAATLLPAVLLLLIGTNVGIPVMAADFMIIMIFFVLYIIALLLYRIHSIKRKVFFALCGFLFFAEVFLNTEHQLYNLTEDKLTLSSLIASTKAKSALTFDPFQNYDVSFESSDVFRPNILPEYYTLSGHYALPDRQHFVFDSANEIYSSIGGSGLLFEKCEPKITLNYPKSALVRQDRNSFIFLNSSRVKNDFFYLYYSIQTDKSGSLVLSTPAITYLGEASSDEPLTHATLFPTLKVRTLSLYQKAAFYNRDGLAELESDLRKTTPQIKHNLFRLEITTPNSDRQTLVLPLRFDTRAKINVDGITVSPVAAPANRTGIYLDAGQQNVIIHYPVGSILLTFALGLCFAFASILLIRQYEDPNRSTHLLDCIDTSENITAFFRKHAVAFSSFLLPLFILLIAICLSSFAPFGGSAYFKSDGAAMTMPNLYATRRSLLQTLSAFSIKDATISSLFYLLISLILNGWLLLVPTGSLIVPATLNSIIRISLCGFTLYLYFTKRLYGKRMATFDYRLLLFTTAYAICSYNLSFRQFIFWADILLIFPLLLLSLDHLMIRGKFLLYTILLAFCMICNTMNTIYLCIFLAMWFFVYKFDSLSDFLKKGIRFALANLFSAGLAFWNLAGNVTSRSTSAYNAEDSILPDPLFFYQSYWNSLRQSFPFSESICVTSNDGAINLYCGFLCILLTILFILFAKWNKRKIGRLLIACFILFSSNNDMMSYIWNGLHFQSKVPNRYSFLLIFLILDMAIDGIFLLQHLTRKQILLLSGSAIVFVILTTVLSTSSDGFLPILSAILILIIFIIGLQFYPKLSKTSRRTLIKLCCFLTITELTLNACYTFREDGYEDGTFIDQSIEISQYLKDNWLKDDPYVRTTYNASESVNQTVTNDVNSLNRFSSFTNVNTTAFASSLGYHTSLNNVLTTTNETPFTSAMINNRFFITSTSVYNPYINTDHYDVIAQRQDGTILENKRLLSEAFYIPKQLASDVSKLRSASELANKFAGAFVPDAKIFTTVATLSESTFTENNSDAICSFSEISMDTLTPYNCHIRFKTDEAGEYYYRCGEYFYLGELDANTEYEYDIPAYDTETGLIVRYDDSAFQKFYDEASKHMLKNITHTDSYMEGTIDMPEDGYILFSYPCNDSYSATLDGKDVPIDQLVNTAMMVKASAGTHTVRINYTTEQRSFPIVITLVFWGVYVILLVICVLLGRRENQMDAGPDSPSKMQAK